MAEPINKLGPHIIGGLPYERSICQTIISIIVQLCLQTSHHMVHCLTGK